MLVRYSMAQNAGCVSLPAGGGLATRCENTRLLSSRLPRNLNTRPRRPQPLVSRSASSARSVLENALVDAEVNKAQPTKPSLGKIITTETSKRADVGSVLENSVGIVKSVVGAATTAILNAFVDLAFKPAAEENITYQGNFGPVPEIAEKTPVKIVAGEIPKDFPAGIYIRNGPNPQFGGNITTSPFGKSLYHWFEGDGMLHGIYFDQDGSVPKYLNRFVATPGYKMEKERGKMTYLTTVEGDSLAIAFSYLLNLLRFGTVNKTTCNTSILKIGDKYYANAEGGLPYEIDPTDLSTGQEYSVNGNWHLPFTAHPKTDLNTGEVVIFGFAATKPHYELGVISADGERLVHRVDLGYDRAIFTHEVSITERYTVVLDWPLVVDIKRLVSGGNLMKFEGDSFARIGVIPRYGDATAIKWFPTETSYTFHILNSYEEGDEVIARGLRSRIPIIPSHPTMDRKEWFARSIAPCKVEDAADPCVDGVLFTRLHEWRMNMKTGALMERDLTGDKFSLEMPRINDTYTSKKNRYGYCNAHNLEESKDVGMPMYGKLLKLDFASMPQEGSAAGSQDLARIQVHQMGPKQYASEPLFVARPGGVEEDDGWVATIVHDESTNISEMIILDAQKFEDEPVVRMQLPQRVPYGFHSTYVQT